MPRSGIREILDAVWGCPDVIRLEVRERDGVSVAPELVTVGRRGGGFAPLLALTRLGDAILFCEFQLIEAGIFGGLYELCLGLTLW